MAETETRRPKLLLIDGHALVYRAYFAMQNERAFTSPRGELTTGTYGFTSMLLKAIELVGPQYVVAAFDTSAPTFRSTSYADYKATRPPAPEGLRSQVRLAWKVLEAMEIPMFRLEGFEADDIIGTLAGQAAERGLQAVILSGDNDLLQIVDEHVKAITPRKGLSDIVLYDVAGVEEKYGGLKPRQIPDFKALRGDSSDNIPSVPGVGDKTAQKLLLQFGTVEALLDNLPQVPEKQRAMLEPFRDQIAMAKGLATIECNAPAQLDLEASKLSPLRRPAVVAVFQELGFKSLIDRLPRPPAPTSGQQIGMFDTGEDAESSPGSPSGRVAQSLDDLDALLQRARQLSSLAFNVQATSVLPMFAEVVGIGLAVGGESLYLPLGHQADGNFAADEVMARLRPIMADAAVAKRGHNLKFHQVLLERHGVPVEGVQFDTMLAAYLLESGQRALALRDLAWAKLQVEMPSAATLLGTGKKALTMDQLPIPTCGDYACREALLVETLTPLLQAELEGAGQIDLFRAVEVPLVPVLARMEATGIGVNRPYLEELGQDLGGRLAQLERQIHEEAGHPFTIGSTQQLSQVLFDELKLQTKTRRQKTKSGHQSTAVEVLEELRDVHPIVGHILEHRQLQKLKSTYVDALLTLIHPQTGRVHTSFNQAIAATGRLSSTDPNLQNIPIRTEEGRRVRRAFVANPGEVLLSADYSQIELRILAHMTDDPTLLDAFARGDDPHAATAAEVMGIPIEQVTSDMRRLAKVVNYGVLYGMSEHGLAQRTDLPPAEAAAFIDRYYTRFGTVREFQDRVIRDTRKLGFAETLKGRRRYIPEINSPIYNVRQAAERQAINAPIQGTASDIVKIAMIQVAAYLADRAPTVKMLLQVHDELLLEGPEADLRQHAGMVCELMQDALELHAPLHVDLKLGPNWEDLRPIKLEAPAAPRA